MLCLDMVNKTTLVCTIVEHCSTVFIDAAMDTNSNKMSNFFLLRMCLVYLWKLKKKKLYFFALSTSLWFAKPRNVMYVLLLTMLTLLLTKLVSNKTECICRKIVFFLLRMVNSIFFYLGCGYPCEKEKTRQNINLVYTPNHTVVNKTTLAYTVETGC